MMQNKEEKMNMMVVKATTNVEDMKTKQRKQENQKVGKQKKQGHIEDSSIEFKGKLSEINNIIMSYISHPISDIFQMQNKIYCLDINAHNNIYELKDNTQLCFSLMIDYYEKLSNKQKKKIYKNLSLPFDHNNTISIITVKKLKNILNSEYVRYYLPWNISLNVLILDEYYLENEFEFYNQYTRLEYNPTADNDDNMYNKLCVDN